MSHNLYMLFGSYRYLPDVFHHWNIFWKKKFLVNLMVGSENFELHTRRTNKSFPFKILVYFSTRI